MTIVPSHWVLQMTLDLLEVDEFQSHTFTAKELGTSDDLMTFYFTSDFPLREALFTNGKGRDQIERFDTRYWFSLTFSRIPFSTVA